MLMLNVNNQLTTRKCVEKKRYYQVSRLDDGMFINRRNIVPSLLQDYLGNEQGSLYYDMKY